MGNISRYSPDPWETQPYLADGGAITAGQLVIQSTADGHCATPLGDDRVGLLGVALNATTAAQATAGTAIVDVCKSGIVRLVADGTITRGDKLWCSTTTGKVKSLTANQTSAAPGVMLVGYALESVADTENCAVLLDIGGATGRSSVIVQMTAGTGGVTKNQICVGGTGGDAGKVVAPAGADPVNGIVGIPLATVLAGATVDVVVSGFALIKAGDASITTAGMALTAQAASGVAKLAAPGAGTNDAIVGISLAAIGSGATGPCNVGPFIMQG